MWILGVEIPDGSYTLVPAHEDEGVGGDVHYVTAMQDPDTSCVFRSTLQGLNQSIVGLSPLSETT
jgi:hypothetical protein